MTLFLKNKELSFLILKEVPIFKDFTDTEIQSLMEVGKMLSVEAFTNVIVEGELTWGLYLILEGHVEILKTDRLTKSNYDIAQLKTSSFFGEMSLIDHQPRSATVRSVSSCEFFFIDKENFMKIIETSIELQFRFYRRCSQLMIHRLRELGDHYLITQYQLWRSVLKREKE